MFDAYATAQLPVTPDGEGGWVWNEPPDRHDASVLDVLSEHTVSQRWWLAYLEAGVAAEVIFDGSGYPKVEAEPHDETPTAFPQRVLACLHAIA